jgi:hypothetical protein
MVAAVGVLVLPVILGVLRYGGWAETEVWITVETQVVLIKI